MNYKLPYLLLVLVVVISACSDKKDYRVHNDDTGTEYAPQMYHSIPYDPYSQIDPHKYNEHGQNLRKPAKGTIARTAGFEETEVPLELTPYYPIPKDCVTLAHKLLKNPIVKDEAALKDGEYLYGVYCTPCHGAEGNGQGTVGKIYGGVANFKAANIANQPSGHIYHVVTMGKGRMYPHGSQIVPKDRWKIVHYVNKLRGYEDKAGAVSADSVKVSATDIASQTEIKEVREGDKLTKVVIQFPSGSAMNLPNPKLDDYLKKSAEMLKKDGKSITLYGHTDNTGGRDMNVRLSRERAEYIKNKLTQFGALAGKIKTKGFGPDEPIAANTTDKGKQQNRRVELKFD